MDPKIINELRKPQRYSESIDDTDDDNLFQTEDQETSGKVTINDIFFRNLGKIKAMPSLSFQQWKTAVDIANCRTENMGYEYVECEECGYREKRYVSCRNRCCPQCQSYRSRVWVENEQQYLLNSPYFHVVFTIPHELNAIFLNNREKCYNLLMRCSSETLKEFGHDEQYLGGEIGIVSILHTWGQQMEFHPHVHCLVTGGALDRENRKWVPTKKGDFLFPVHALTKKFRGMLLDKLVEEKLSYTGTASEFADSRRFYALMKTCYEKDWVVYCKPPYSKASVVLDYFSRYTFRICISNKRIVKYENDKVYFRWRDYSDNNKVKMMCLNEMEFIRRFLLHVLPKGFAKVRHTGIYASRNKKKKVALCKVLTNTQQKNQQKATTREFLEKLLGRDVTVCPKCGSKLITHMSIQNPLLSDYKYVS